MIGVKDYENMEGFGMSTYEQVAELNKALSAGYDVPAASGGISGSGLRVESLEASLKVVTFQMQHIKLWQKIPKLPAYSTVEEYNRLTTYGSEGGAFAPEGELNQYNDATYTRQVSLVKFLQTVRKVTHPMTLVRTAHGDIIGNEIKNGIMWLLGQMEYYLYNGDSTLRYSYAAMTGGATTNEGYEFDGIKNMIDSTMVIDCGGDPLSEDILETAANQIIENYGFPTDIFIGTKPLADLAKIMFPKERIVVPFKEGQIGVPLNTFASQAGTLAFNPDVFLRRKMHTYGAAATGGTGDFAAPTAPQSLAIVVDTDEATGDWTKTGGGLGTYYYAVTYGNRFGESTAAYASATVATTTTSLWLNPRNASSVVVVPEYINIYRSAVGDSHAGAAGTVYYLIQKKRVAATYGQTANAYQTTNGSTVDTANCWVSDLNAEVGGCHNVYMGELTPQVLMFKQLAPMMKMDLAVIDPSIRWVQLLYGVPQMYAPKKFIRIKNVGEATV